MDFGICNLSVIPARIEPDDRSEMVNQLLFGEHFEIIRYHGSWAFVRLALDSYECWIDRKQYQEISTETFLELQQRPVITSLELLHILEEQESGNYMPIALGSSLPYYDSGTCNLEGFEYLFDGQTNEKISDKKSQFVCDVAYTFMNAPYLWGGRSPLGIDCSGLTQVVYKTAGIKLNRDAYQQAEQGQTLSFLDEAQPGDLLFFDNAEGRIIHVGILINDNKIIHASGKVRIDMIDHQGIFNHDTQRYTHNLRLIKRVI